MPPYVIADVEIKDAAGMEPYRDAVEATVKKYGGRFVVRGGKHEVLEGQWRPVRLVLLEFPSLDAAKKWYDSADYGKIKPIRLQHSVGHLVLVEGL